MEKLLQWSTAQESDDPAVRARAPAPDPKILAQVLGANTGKDDATLMKEDISVLVCDDPQISICDKLTALEDFEILVQNLDNANNISPMGIWPEISKLYTYTGEEEDEFRGLAALITGTAVQNNVKCQNDFLKNIGEKGMQDLLQLTEKANNFNVRARALYAISGLVAHNGALYELFIKCDGWKALSGLLSEHFENNKKDNKIVLRCLNLLKSLLYDEIIEEGKSPAAPKTYRLQTVKENDVVLKILAFVSGNSHFDINERVLNILNYIADAGYSYSDSEKSVLKEKLSTVFKDSYNNKEVSALESIL